MTWKLHEAHDVPIKEKADNFRSGYVKEIQASSQVGQLVHVTFAAHISLKYLTISKLPDFKIFY